MQRRNLTRLGISVFLVAAAAVVIWKHPWSPGGGPDLKFDTVAVDKGPIEAKVSATGTLAPRHTVTVGAQVSGKIIWLSPDGDFNSVVKQGEEIAKIDPTLIDAQIAQSTANVASAAASLTKAKVALADAIRQNKRTQSLAQQNLVSTQTAETAQVTEDTSRAAVASAQAELAQAEAQLSMQKLNRTYTTITSPVNGVVISRAVDVGQTVASSLSAPTLFTIAEDLSRMQIDTSVAEGDVGRLKEDMQVHFTVDAFPGHVFDGTVHQIRNSATTISGVVTYDAVIWLDNSSKEFYLRPGMTANVTFVLAQVADTVRVPNAALRFKPTPAQLQAMFGGDGAHGGRGRRNGSGSGSGSASGSGSSARGGDGGSGGPPDPTRKTVWKLVDGKARPVKVKVGLTDNSKTELLEGDLQPGDQLVTAVSGAPTTTSGPGGPIRF
jgi:HlyD family secretion protein